MTCTSGPVPSLMNDIAWFAPPASLTLVRSERHRYRQLSRSIEDAGTINPCSLRTVVGAARSDVA
jgi:hypothetical protein